MARSIVLGNGESLIALDKFGRVCDFYFPKVGLENHIGGKNLHKIGVEISGNISWLGEDKNWNIKIKSEEKSLESLIEAENKSLGISLSLKDLIYNEHSIFVRSIDVVNKSKNSREIKIHFSHKFQLSESKRKDTVFFDHKNHTVLHYKGQRVFMINGEMEGEPFREYKVGEDFSEKASDDKADSIISFHSLFLPDETKKVYYWVIAAHSIDEACNLNTFVLKKTPESIIKSTRNFWRNSIDKYDLNFYKLKPEVVSLFKKSLMIISSHVDNGGSIISSADSSVLNKDKDTYSYMWMREAAFGATALLGFGNKNFPKKFFEFCKDTINTEGYFMHKYSSDKSIGPSWQPRVIDGQFQLPIQEDETAIVIWALYEYYKRTHDIDFIESIYDEVIEKASDFMVNYRDTGFKLPKPSFDLWDEKFGVSAYTCASVYGALVAAAELSRLLGKIENAKKYKDAAEEIKKGILNYLYDKSSGNFFKLINCNGNNCTEDETIDISSIFGVFFFGVLPINDTRLERAMNQTIGALSHNIKGLGIARYFGDKSHKTKGKAPGNPWFISTLWFAQYLISKSQSEKDFDRVREYLEWVAEHALPSGILSEQLNPSSGDQLSVSPLIWSHSEFVNTVNKYLNRTEELGISKTRNSSL